jgi:hypothetical protein
MLVKSRLEIVSYLKGDASMNIIRAKDLRISKFLQESGNMLLNILANLKFN